MTSKYPPAPGKEAFVAQLRAFHKQCGQPSYRTLASFSQDLSRLHPSSLSGKGRFPALSVSAISEILAGQRKNPPSADWVASFVLCCQRWAAQTGSISDDPGIGSLPEWQARLRAAHGAQEGPAAAGTDGTGRPEQHASAVPAGTAQLPAHQRDYVASHGPHGQALIARAQAGHPDALYRVAILLLTDPARSEDALALLLRAAAARHSATLTLLDENPARLAPLQAARIAYQLAQAAEASSAHAEAIAYYQAAARGGQLAAAIKLATAALARHGEHQTAAWLAAAADSHGEAPGLDLAEFQPPGHIPAS